jgi:thiol:disulfide interchange protein
MNELFINIFLAFLGGLIMNFMPCILPLISLKISSLIDSSEENKKIYIEKSFAYIFGIICFFLCFAIFLSIFKFSGQNIIFGSHMQSGIFLFIIFIILFLIGLNLAGLFEFEINFLTNHASNIIFKSSGLISDYFNGLLVSILSIPCTAPFIASAFTFALGTNYINIFLITIFMGLGFASPFFLLILFPNKILKILPKPGLWMEKFKVLMSFPIFGSALWILFVLIKQNNIKYISLALFSSFLIYFFIFFWKNFFKKNKILKIIFFIILIIISYFIFPNIQNNDHVILEKNINPSYDIKYGIKEEFSEEKLKKYISLNKKIFIVASASWCITCHVNEKNALSSEEFFKTLKDKKIIYLYIDLTNKNEEGQNFLASKNQIGIPFYLLINSNSEEKKLPQILKPNFILNELNNLK